MEASERRKAPVPANSSRTAADGTWWRSGGGVYPRSTCGTLALVPVAVRTSWKLPLHCTSTRYVCLTEALRFLQRLGDMRSALIHARE